MSAPKRLLLEDAKKLSNVIVIRSGPTDCGSYAKRIARGPDLYLYLDLYASDY